MKAFLNIEACKGFTEATGIEVCPLRPYKKLDLPVSSHADMLINIIEENIFCYEDYYWDNKEIFDIAEKNGYKVIKCTPPVSSQYPHDIGLNALVMDKRIFGKIDFLSTELKAIAIEKGYELINVNQGYTAGTTLALDGQNAVTADVSVKNALESCGIKVTFIREQNIKLPGYNTGFIGGAGLVCDGKIFVFGNAETLLDYSKIKAHVDALEMSIISILSGDVVDFGGAKLIF